MAALDWIDRELSDLRLQGLLRTKRVVRSLGNGRCEVGGRQLWNFAANDYLGLAGDSRLLDAAQRAMMESGLGSCASPLVTGRTEWHCQLESALARFKHAEAAILFPTGFAANLGTISALVGSEDVVFCDRLNHASLVDGCRLSRARFRVFPHRDVTALRRELEKSSQYRRRLIVTDSVFSMDGDEAPLAELNDLAVEFDAMLLVDEAHATGIFGQQGTGLIEESEVASDRVIAVGTLSKAIGLQGGFVAGKQNLIDWLWNSARTQVFSTGLAIPVCAAATASLELIGTEPQRRTWLRETSLHVQKELRDQGWNLPMGIRGPIIPVIVGEADEAMKRAQQLEDRGILVAAIRPPTVPRGTCRLRISLSYAHGDEGIAALLDAFRSLM